MSAGGRGRVHFTGCESALVLGVVLQLLAVAAHHERHREDADEARRDGDQQHIDKVVVVDLDERQDRGRRSRDGARGDPESVGDRRSGERALGPDLVGVGDLVDHRDDREERVARAGEDREQVRHIGRHEVERLGSRAQCPTCDHDHVVDAACCLHRRRGGDDGDDDQDRADRRLARVEPEHEDENERAHTAPQAEPDSSRADAERDEADDDETLDCDEDPVHRLMPTAPCPEFLTGRTSSGERWRVLGRGGRRRRTSVTPVVRTV